MTGASKPTSNENLHHSVGFLDERQADCVNEGALSLNRHELHHTNIIIFLERANRGNNLLRSFLPIALQHDDFKGG